MGNFKDFLKGLPSTTFAHCKRNAAGVASTTVTIPNCVLQALQASPGIVGAGGQSAKQRWEEFVVRTVGYKADPNRSITSQVSSVLDFWFVKDSNEWSKSPITRVCEGKSPVRYFYQEAGEEEVLTGVRCALRPTGRGEPAPVRAAAEAIRTIEGAEKLGITVDPKIKEDAKAALAAAQAAAPVRASSQEVASLKAQLQELQDNQARVVQEQVMAALMGAGILVKPV